MFYENELRLISDVLRKRHIRVAHGSARQCADATFATELWELFGRGEEGREKAFEFLSGLESRTLYKYRDILGMRYVCLLMAPNECLVIGPYVNEPIPKTRLLEMCEELSLSPKAAKLFCEHFLGVPTLEENSTEHVMIDSFCERIWETGSFAIIDSEVDSRLPASPINEAIHRDNFDDVLMSMKAMEERYRFENELIRAVTLGQIHKEKLMIGVFSNELFEKRVADPLRNAKNYCIIMNTLLRKAAEEGGVHPLYIDRVSSEYAQRIEQCPATSAVGELMREMFRAYCRLVRKHSLKNLSGLVQKTVLLIDSDLAADLSLRSLAANQGVSAGYLSSLFKRETGKTVSEYIREKRMKHAAHLLSTTRLQIQTVAMHCGIMDVQYFSKQFKREVGMSPKEYRDSRK